MDTLVWVILGHIAITMMIIVFTPDYLISKGFPSHRSSWSPCSASCGSATQSRWSRCADSAGMMDCIQVLLIICIDIVNNIMIYEHETSMIYMK